MSFFDTFPSPCGILWDYIFRCFEHMLFHPCQRDDDPHRNKGHQALGAVSQKAFGDPILRSGRMLDVPCQVKRTPLFWLFLVGCMTAIMDRFHCVPFSVPADNES